MDGATMGNMKSMLRTIKYVLDTKYRVLSYDTREQEGSKWILKSFSDSDWAGSKDDRRSITGSCIYLNGCLVSWKLRGQKHVTLSSIEAEYLKCQKYAQTSCSLGWWWSSLGWNLKDQSNKPDDLYYIKGERG